MKKSIIYGLIGIWSLTLLNTSCMDEGLNQNPIGITDEDLYQDNNHIGAYFPAIQQMIYCNYNWGWGTDWTFQVMQNLNADLFSGYMATATNFSGNVNNQTYTYMPGWSDPAWDYTYSYLMPNTLDITKKCNEDYEVYSHFDAINKILKVLAISRLSDMYGPVIYSEYGKSATGGKYDSVQDLYKSFFKDLDEAVATLDTYIDSHPGQKPFKKFDMVYAGEYSNWVKFANTLRLRLALRIVKADEATAKTEAEKAVNAPYGVMETNKDNFVVKGGTYFHPLTAISQWGDISISANIESILGGYDDPRLSAYALPAIDGTHKGEVKGMRMGIHNLDKFQYIAKTDPITYKVSPTIYFNDNTMPAILMTAAESNFLRAEAALRGWDSGIGTGDGVAKSFYEAGVNISFVQWEVASGTYFTTSNKPADFIDQLQPDTESSAAVSTTTTNWDDATSKEEKLEKIITQKWIAGFPEGYNAWAEYRRTGYPKLFPITNNTSGGEVPTSTGFRRVQFSSAELSGNAAGVADATVKLGGPDKVTTRIWWDVNIPNF